MLFIIYHELMNMVPLTSLLQNFEMDPVTNDDTIYFWSDLKHISSFAVLLLSISAFLLIFKLFHGDPYGVLD